MKQAASMIMAVFLVLGSHAAYGGGQMKDMRITSQAFKANAGIPPKYTCDGENINPPLRIEGVPEGAKSLALILDDPDAPHGDWVHWVVWNINPRTTEIKEGSAPEGAVQGTTDFKKRSYGGPCPPSGTHRYFFRLYALDTTLDLGPRSGKKEVEKAMRGHVISQAELMARYEKKREPAMK